MTEEYQRSFAISLDENNTLAPYHKEFYLKENSIYMDGNSLGLMSKRAEDSTLSILESWKKYGIDGWTEGEYPWFHLSEQLGEKMAKLVGGQNNEVIATGSTTTNIHQLVSTFYEPKGKRNKILADALTFPSDIYALKSQLKLKGYDESYLIQVESKDGNTLQEEDIIRNMTDDIALVVLPSVLYRSGQILDMKRLTKEAKSRNIPIGFDLCHSIGAIPHQLHEWGVDFAVWCTYKHLNGGPGSVAGLFLHEKNFNKGPGLAGWFSSDKNKQFDMEHILTPAEDASAFQIGTPHLLSAAPLVGALDLFNEVGVEKIRRTSLELTDYMMKLIEHELEDFDFKIMNPINSKYRGAHIYVEHLEAGRICKALKENNVIPDFRKPSGIRLAPVALYNSFEDVFDCVQILKKIMKEKSYKKFDNVRDVVS